MTDASKSAYSHWSDYWASGALTSLPQDFAGNYDGEVEQFWRQCFSRLSGRSDARMLDVCTGNGPIALLAARWAEEAGQALSIMAVDAATPNPGALIRTARGIQDLLGRIDFIASTPIEALPFDEAEFDLITSQYGIEYSDLSRSAPELARVLKPGGELAVVTHGADSDMVETMAREAEDYALLRNSGALRLLGSWESGQLADPDLVRRLEPVIRRLFEAARRPGASPLLAQVGQSLLGLIRISAAERRAQKSAISGFRRQLLAGQARLEDMLRVNRMIAESDDWADALEAAGLEPVETAELMYRGKHRMGRSRIWRRPLA
ncbi:class I SAM-dependent methyltransferase [Wenzhouxiangella marina]|uniref:Methylase involved in ubiquinone/menaquinone biosynthesis n=1 Tax=Wenzhouxiangella marina TaxID=1579979 RepID=A0A0K0XZR9_9GAMM|nr:class I SAM-dependent methyltransferase [Wenzhouxiangella marina]AKS43137.1 Methylase involved in ubiquinone/menaquinone biosynthesis [Wenzhouxiangella marina]MBB6087178.1 ubiquinone/menaquinone biosynthesis C-methylase UbiE [Wenzhouxiangella marina]